MRNAFFIMGLTIALGMPPALAANSEATRSVTIYHSPEMNLEEVDRQLLDQVGNGSTINFAAFILSDYRIMDSLRGAADRGARIRIYLDPKEILTQRFTEKHPFVKLWRTRGVDMKIKAVDDGFDALEGLFDFERDIANGFGERQCVGAGTAGQRHSGYHGQSGDRVVQSQI